MRGLDGMKSITCHSALHDLRSKDDGRDWRMIVGWYSGDFPSAPHYCNRCAFAEGKGSDSMTNVERERRIHVTFGQVR